jgi:hypothetical protein
VTANGSAVTLTWAPSTSSTGAIASYQISRNGVPLPSVAGTLLNYADAQVQPGVTYSYTVTAVDSTGSSSAPGTSNPITTPLLSTDFETGSLSGWRPVVGGVQPGTFAAQVTSTGGQSFMLENLPSSSTTMYAQGSFNIASQNTSTTLLGLRTPAMQIAQVYLSNIGQVELRNNFSGTNYVGTTTLLHGSWYQVTLGVNETLGRLQVWVGADLVLSQTGQSLGSVPMSNVQIGDDSIGRIYSWSVDDITVSTSSLPLG